MILGAVSVAERGQANRAYMAEMAVLCQLYPDRVLGWPGVGELRDWFDEWTESYWWLTEIAPLMPATPRVTGAGGSEVSRYVPVGQTLRMTRWDLQLVTFTHELAHAVDAAANGLSRQQAHRPSWAAWHVRLLREHDKPASELLATAYQHMDVL